jgi:TPR repeat protein
MYNLALCYKNGKRVEKNYQFAFQLLLSASNDGDLDSMYQCFLYLSRGIGVQRDMIKSFSFLQSVGQQNYFHSFIENGIILLEGIFVDQNEDKNSFLFSAICKLLRCSRKILVWDLFN